MIDGSPDPGARIDRLADELASWRDGISRELASTRDQILDRIEAGYVRKDVQEQHIQRMDERIAILSQKIGRLEAAQEWIIRLVLGCVIVAILGLVIVNR